VLAVVLWCALLASGIDPVVAGLAVGLATSAYVPRRDALEQATTPGPVVPRAADAGARRRSRRGRAARIAQDIDSADRSGVAGTPTFFINNHRHDGPQDLPTLTHAIEQTLATAT
jgi:protein-disulfide isomerase